MAWLAFMHWNWWPADVERMPMAHILRDVQLVMDDGPYRPMDW